MLIKEWKRNSGKSPVADYIKNLQAEDQVDVIIKLNRFEKYGKELAKVEPRTIKPLDKGISELKIRCHRILFTVIENVAWLLVAFKKEKNKTERQYLQTAVKRARTIEGFAN